jgi:hypothetical protein
MTTEDTSPPSVGSQGSEGAKEQVKPFGSALGLKLLAMFHEDENVRQVAAHAGRRIAELVAALKRADEFITNGIELGYIRMPDPETRDAALETPRLIRSALRAASAQGDR